MTFLYELGLHDTSVLFVRLPYVEATMLEIMRYKSLAAYTVRSTRQDTEVQGYFIPRGTQVISHFFLVF